MHSTVHSTHLTKCPHATSANACGTYHGNNAGNGEGDDVRNNQSSVLSVDLLVSDDRVEYKSVLHMGEAEATVPA